MKNPLALISWTMLVVILVPCLLFVAGTINLDTLKWLAFVGTIVWFVVTPLWMGVEKEPDDAEVQI